MKITEVENKVREVLKENELARNDDFILIEEVFSRFNSAIKFKSFKSVMENHAGLPSIESITRARRKVQNENKELMSNKQIARARENLQEDYIDYAINQ